MLLKAQLAEVGAAAEQRNEIIHLAFFPLNSYSIELRVLYQFDCWVLEHFTTDKIVFYG